MEHALFFFFSPPPPPAYDLQLVSAESAERSHDKALVTLSLIDRDRHHVRSKTKLKTPEAELSPG